jgi:methylated-DNA-[protein]-cysteine S-methyltransferase
MAPIKPDPRDLRPPEHYHIFSSSFGLCGLAWSEKGVTAFQLPEGEKRALEARMRKGARQERRGEPPQMAECAVKKLQRFFDGEKIDFSDLSLDLDACRPFDKAVYHAALSVRWGETATYGDLARKIGSPNAARAVGYALSKNPIAIIVPCHRIVAAGAKIGGFSAHGGVALKERLLRLEGGDPGADAAPQQHLFAQRR